MAKLEQAGVITGLFRYPIKSMRGEELLSVMVTQKAGVDGDRRYAFQQTDPASRKGFPWLTGRDNSQMVLYTPHFDGKTLVVATTDGRVLPASSDVLIDELRQGSRSQPAIHLTHLGRGAWDGFPISIMGEDTVEAVAARSGLLPTETPDARRYRPNIVVETNPPREGAEDRWVRRVLQFGDSDTSPVLYVARPDERCTMIRINPDTAAQEKAVLVDVARNRGNEMGVYAMVLREGEMHAGEPIYFANLS